jgi:hypothetical protein
MFSVLGILIFLGIVVYVVGKESPLDEVSNHRQGRCECGKRRVELEENQRMFSIFRPQFSHFTPSEDLLMTHVRRQMG